MSPHQSKLQLDLSVFHKPILLSLSLSHPDRTPLFVDMADWGPVIIAVALFVVLIPGLLFQIPGKNRVVEFGNMQTSVASMAVHAIIYFGLITIFLIAIGVHVHAG
ncbi:hypothetical protein OIU79_029646 [Salix purpurea]|uniref:Transmembrane protein n=1 Tax=Salix purpurea TaxID=77065 RepID=A0A9Q0VJ73_SALPP|nr:hypothetical protein OIU79_029646 [Salix purpurea]